MAQPRTLEEVGPEVRHLFQALNLGPSSTPPAQLAISWPVKTPANTELLYLTKVEVSDVNSVLWIIPMEMAFTIVKQLPTHTAFLWCVVALVQF